MFIISLCLYVLECKSNRVLSNIQQVSLLLGLGNARRFET